MPSRRDILSLIGRTGAGLAALSAFGPGARRVWAGEPDIYKGHGAALYGAPKYGPEFQHFEYVNPAAPKGGRMYQGEVGTFDSLNPFTLMGNPFGPEATALVFDSLMKGSADEPFSMYGLIARSIEMPKDRSWVVFALDERARFHDGSPITAEDVKFSFEKLTGKEGHPRYSQYYKDVVKAEPDGAHAIKFTFREAGNRELPLIMGQLPIIPKAYWSVRQFDQVTLDRPLGSGPYKIGEFSPGRFLTLERVRDYWATEHPANRGHNNFDFIRYDYFRDSTIAREAFKAGEFDFQEENQALAWALQYETEAVKQGLMIKRAVPHSRPQGMQCFIMNTRRPQFKDWRVRRALTLMFDFEWTNKNLFFGQYTRSKSFFSNSEMAATGLPEGEELKILERFRGRIPDSVFTEPYTLPVYAGDGNIRSGARQAIPLLKEAGFDFRGTDLVDKTGQPLRFEILTASQAFERIFLPYVSNLERIGVTATLRLIDMAQYRKRWETFDYDMIAQTIPQSESPGNEQRNYWSIAAAKITGSYNFIGVSDKAIDELVELLIAAPDRESLVTRCKALDRVLLHHHFVVPSWYLGSDRLVWWDKFGAPPPHRRGTSWQTWWYDPAKAERLKGRIRSQP